MERPRVVAVTGGSGSGKTTIVNRLTAQCGHKNVLTLGMDNYYRDLSHLTPEERELCNFDHPHAFDFELMKEQLSNLLEGRSVERPSYDFATHTRKDPPVMLSPQPAIIIDGILALNDAELRELCDLSVYVEVSDDVRFIRRLKRDVTERGRTIDSVINQYLTSVKPMHDTFVSPQKRVADIIVSWEGYNDPAVAMLGEMISGWVRGSASLPAKDASAT